MMQICNNRAARRRTGYSEKVSLQRHVSLLAGFPVCLILLELYGESAGARTQDQRLKRAMLYQLSYALTNHLFKVSTLRGVNSKREIFGLPVAQMLV